MKKLIYISHWRFPSEKTMSPLIMRSCAEFAKRGFDVELWVPRRHNPSFVNVDARDYHKVSKSFVIRRLWALDLMYIVPTSVPFFLILITFNLSVWWRAFKNTNLDTLFFCHDQRDAILLNFLRRKIVYEIHDFYYSRLSIINSFTFKKAFGFVVTNKLKMDILHKDFGIPYEKMAHEPNAVDVEKFSQRIAKDEARAMLGLPKDGRIVLYTGHLFDWKGVYTLAEAAEFTDSNTSIYFVGGTEEDRNELKKFISQRQLGGITFLPHQEHSKMPVFLQAADVLVLPNTGKVKTSAIETSPVKLFEYLCSGRPIVASDLPSIRNVVDEKSVFFFRPDDARSIASTVEYVLYHPEEVEKRVAYARILVEEYTWDKRFDRVVDFLQNKL